MEKPLPLLQNLFLPLPTLATCGMDGGSGVLKNGTTSDTGPWGFKVEYAAARERPNPTITPDNGDMGWNAGVLTGGITTDRDVWGGVSRMDT